MDPEKIEKIEDLSEETWKEFEGNKGDDDDE